MHTQTDIQFKHLSQSYKPTPVINKPSFNLSNKKQCHHMMVFSCCFNKIIFKIIQKEQCDELDSYHLLYSSILLPFLFLVPSLPVDKIKSDDLKQRRKKSIWILF
ncbi:hypothetical protein ILYODFUR_001457 [Ilyodon furcidens]|uniref:Uncharacterized protein n=1 Tax=Ilyodon furcidens TaxID=33524 RepID=A0ABV0UCF9_9TELE